MLLDDLEILLLALCIVLVYFLVIRHLHGGSLACIPGPPSPSGIFGHTVDLQHQHVAGELEQGWLQTYGNACKISGPFSQELLLLADPKALHYVVQASGYRYPKPHDTNQAIRLMMGRGIFWAVGDDHKRHKKVMSPAFDIARLRSFLPLFQRSATMLAERWKSEIRRAGPTLEITAWIQRLMLDNIGEAAFDHRFNALDHGEAGAGELSDAFNNLFADSLMFPDRPTILFTALWRFIPPRILRFVEYLPARQVQRFHRFLTVSKTAAKRLLDNRSREDKAIQCEEGGVDGERAKRKDILNILVQSNSHEADEKRKLDEDELLSQMATIMLAGHDSTSVSLSWLLHDLAHHPEDQERVRQEVCAVRSRAADPDCLGVVDLEAMTYTNAVIRETLRLHPIAFMLPRMAREDDVIPLATPITTTKGDLITEIPIKKGQHLYLAIYTYNRLKSVWGEDADQWNPGRFLGNGTRDKEYTMGMFANLLTFSGGVRGCLGWRFAILELQATLVGLIEHFQFAPVQGIEIQGAPAGSMIPVIKGRETEGTQLPLCVTVIEDEAEQDM
ncbi:hypothetical protein D9619_007490 [Psilocybe cf. subviscida]|uniref:Cytochrome P450 n=1 Tax=Psilocybe cf. subviscida TaxID=2480587 RepID=A0A8H5EWC4_9AGAR|nr:hypothetical protein D9619_007490 [Psilocybe cf. subviscida]